MPAPLRLTLDREAMRAHFAAKERERNRRRRHAVQAAKRRGTHTEEEWDSLLMICGHACVECGDRGTERMPLQKDHIVAVSAFGCECISNIQPLCMQCNAAKGAHSSHDLRPADWRELLECFE